MNKILDKLGIYDLIAVLLSGISITIFTIFFAYFLCNIRSIVVNPFNINETLVFFVISYFIGLIFQEVSSFIEKRLLFRNHALLKIALNTSRRSYSHLTTIEKERIYNFVEMKLQLIPSQDNDYVIYNYIKFSVKRLGETARIDKNQSMSAMSRSFTLYFIIIFLVAILMSLYKKDIYYFEISMVFLCFSILFLVRSVRFAILRYIYFFRIFYYYVVLKED